MTLSAGIPIIRIFPGAKAKEFYLDFSASGWIGSIVLKRISLCMRK
jgi:hypothetical protein